MGLLRFGLQPAIVRYVARYSALKDSKGLNEIYSTALIFMGIVGAVSAMALMIWALVGADMLAENPGSASRYSVFLMVIATQVFVQFPGTLFMSVHHGFQRYNLTNLFTAINSIVFSAIMFMLLTRGYGLLSLAFVNTIGIGFKYAIYGYLLRLGKYGGFIFRIRDVSMDAFKELFSFGAKSFVLGISSRISSSTDSIVIGSILGPVFVTFYMIPVNLVRHASSLISTITLNFMPFFSDLDAKQEKGKAKETFIIYSRYVAGLSIILLLGICLVGTDFIALWMGPSYAQQGRTVLYIIAFAFLIPMLNPFHGRLLTSAGRHGILAKIRPAEAVLNLLLSLVLIQFMGKEGVALATLIAAVVAAPFVLVAVCRYIGISVSKFLKCVLAPHIVPALIALASYFIFLSHINMVHYMAIITVSLAIAFFYTGAFFVFSIPFQEKQLLFTKVRALFVG
jgi:O-antigen/teichoic acid export membrane protein